MRGHWRRASGTPGRGTDGRVLIVGSIVVAGGSAAAATWWFTGPWAALVGAVGATAAGVWSSRGLTRRDNVDANRIDLGQHLHVDGRGRLPRVSACANPHELGVHRAAAGDTDLPAVPPFIVRDITADLHDALCSQEFVLLVGDSTAGKTRAAYEAMREVLTDHLLIQPDARAAVTVAVEAARGASQPCVIWLDDLERFLGTGGLTRGDVRALVSGPAGPAGHRNVILATMRAEEYARFTQLDHRGPDRLSTETRRQGEDVIRQAHRIHVPRLWSTAEVARLGEHDSDPRFREALGHADDFGISEYLASGPQLLGAWQAAWAPGTHPRGAALVSAGVLARRCGIHRPLPAAVLADAAQAFLDERGGARLRPEPADEAVTWATTPLYATSSLLLPDDHGSLLAFDYLIDALPKTRPPRAAVAALIGAANADEAVDLAELAQQWRHLDEAEAALRRTLGHPEARVRLEARARIADLIDDRDGALASLRFASDLAREHEARLGRDAPEALSMRSLEVWQVQYCGDTTRALALAEELFADLRRCRSQDVGLALDVQRAIYTFRGGIGDFAEAARGARESAVASEAHVGPDATATVHDRMSHVVYTGHAEGPGRASARLRALLDDPALLPGTYAHRYATTASAHESAEDGEYELARPLFARLLRDEEERFGANCSDALYFRYQLAGCAGHLDSPEAAVRMLEAVLAGHARLGDVDSERGLRYQRRLATWIGMAGRPGEAASRLRRLVQVSRARNGPGSYQTLALRSRAAHWTAEAGDVTGAVREFREVLTTYRRTVGPNAHVTVECRERLRHWEDVLTRAS